MFHDIPEAVRQRMAWLEAKGAEEKAAGLERFKRLRQITPDAGRFLAIMLASAPAGRCLEIGTSGGYSALWLALACRATGRRLVTFELTDEKAALARETFRLAGVEDVVELRQGDALTLVREYDGVGFCFLDVEKGLYADCHELVAPRLVPGGLLVADNVISHAHELTDYLALVERDGRVDSVTAPVGSGLMVCRRT